jgi:hypothetical protein
MHTSVDNTQLAAITKSAARWAAVVARNAEADGTFGKRYIGIIFHDAI